MRRCVACLTLLVPTLARAQTVLPPPPAAPAGAPAAAPAPAPVAAPAPVVAPTPIAAPAPVAAPAPAPVSAPLPESPKHGAPLARRGFQMHFVPMTALMFPFGEASGATGDTLSARYAWQWQPFEVGLGAKITDELYLGGYLNVGVGLEGSDLASEARCDAGTDTVDDVSCSAASVRAGLEVRYSFTPAEPMSGWIGYGFGFTSGSQYISDVGRYGETSTASGLELARLTGGLDFRFKRGFGLGPYAMASIGRYTHRRTEINNVATFSGDIDEPGVHLWLGLGLRMVIFP